MQKEGINVRMGMDYSAFQAGLGHTMGMAGGWASRMYRLILSPTGAFIALGSAAVLAGRKSVNAFADFEYKMSEVATICDDVTFAMENLGRAALDIAQARGFKARDVAGAMYQAISAGIDPKQAEQFVDTASRLARGGFIPLENSVRLLAGSMNAYSAQGIEAKRISDSLFNTVRQGITTMSELEGAIGRVTSIAATFGILPEDINSAIALLTKNQLQTTIAVTGLRAVILDLINPSSSAAEAMRRYGLFTDESAMKAKGLTGVLEDLGKVYKEHPEILKQIFTSSRALTVAAKLVPNWEEQRKMFEQQLAGAGATERAAQIADATITAFRQRLSAKWEAFWINMGRQVSVIMPELLGSLNRMADGMDTFFNKWNMATRIIQFFRMAWNVLAAAVRAAVAVILNLIGLLMRGLHAFGVFWQSIWDRIGQGFWKVMQWIVEMFGSLVRAIQAPFRFFAKHFDPTGRATQIRDDMQDFIDEIDKVSADFAGRSNANAEEAADAWKRAGRIIRGEDEAWYDFFHGVADAMKETAAESATAALMRIPAVFGSEDDIKRASAALAEFYGMAEEGGPGGLYEGQYEGYSEAAIQAQRAMENNVRTIRARWQGLFTYLKGEWQKRTQEWRREWQKRVNIVETSINKIKAIEQRRKEMAEWGERVLYDIRTQNMSQADRMNEAMKMYARHVERASVAMKVGEFEEAVSQYQKAIGYLQTIATGDVDQKGRPGVAARGAYQEIQRLILMIDQALAKQKAAEEARMQKALNDMKQLENAWKRLEAWLKNELQIKVDVGPALGELEKLRQAIIKVYQAARNEALNVQAGSMARITGGQTSAANQFVTPARHTVGGETRVTIDNININVPKGTSRDEIRNLIIKEIQTAIQRVRWQPGVNTR